MVDDDIELAENTKRWLTQSENHQVDCCYNAEDAEQMLSQFRYDLLIFDWEMPGMSGVETGLERAFLGSHQRHFQGLSLNLPHRSFCHGRFRDRP